MLARSEGHLLRNSAIITMLKQFFKQTASMLAAQLMGHLRDKHVFGCDDWDLSLCHIYGEGLICDFTSVYMCSPSSHATQFPANAMQCNAVLCCAVLCCAVLCCAVHHVMLPNALPMPCRSQQCLRYFLVVCVPKLAISGGPTDNCN